MNNINVLIVDDEKDNRFVLSSFLSEFNCIHAESCMECLDIISTKSIDLILLDILMPGLDGFGCIERIKSIAEYQDVPVIFLTALQGVEDHIRGLHSGAVDYITKPFNREIVELRAKNQLFLKLKTDALKAAHSQLASDKLILDSTLNQIGAAFFTVDQQNNNVLYANKAAERLLNTPLEKMVGNSYLEIIGNHCCLANDSASTQEGDTVSCECVMNVNGTKKNVLKHTVWLNGKVSDHYVEILFDQTEKKELEQRLSIAQRLETLGLVAAGISHEINTPSQYIAGNLQYIKEGLADISDLLLSIDTTELPEGEFKLKWEKRKDILLEYINDIPGAIDDSLKGITSISDIAISIKRQSFLGEEGKVGLSMCDIIDDVIKMTKNKWKYCCELVYESDESIPHIKGFQTSLTQAFINLIVNAVDSIEEKHSQQRSLGKIKIRLVSDQKNILVTISDNGMGIDDSIKERMFEPFFTTKDVGKGTGQGLSIVYESIVKKHNGSIDIECLDEGVSFNISIPINQPVPSIQEATSQLP